ncbi:DUF4376 domain-containing protein [Escherichia coli]|uniref:DUF4376 domain-containing protein n=1 Tax=Escherichia coli TaxID=562 RepID=A0A8S7S8Y8_ECOLX|nr:DUF4376 domain-containing protein [Escherichia coli]EFB2398792.1 DUF4376 domain-containing protein [Escherichia coli]EFB2403489.1 DUF4376 domain-containing protein [Escherichia coli]EFE7859830.1 DUF4376 domain-containing protein [Escherichia coli]EFH2630197.1 DUF4376 domain-containing protein [Escherichia coli]
MVVVIFALICSGGHGSMVRLPPVVMSAKSATARTTIAREDAEDHQVKLSAQKLEELAAAMAQAQVDRNDEIYQRQRELKEELSSLGDLNSVRNFIVE